jgi:hypothetical protein
LRCGQIGKGFDLPDFTGGDEFGFVVGVEVEEGIIQFCEKSPCLV